MNEETGAAQDVDEAGAGAGGSEQFNLSRVLSLLSIIIGLVALGFISSLFLNLDGRLETLETSYPVTSRTLDEKIETLSGKLSGKAFSLKTPVAGAKQLYVGSELASMLFLMRYVAGDPSFSESVREQASQLHAEADAMLNDLQAGK
ncbi:MAG TPA: hypothetical protein ENI77_04275 [Nitrospirae bacterium]|nr:hypothetical protein [Nitrospirota bacterium]